MQHGRGPDVDPRRHEIEPGAERGERRAPVEGVARPDLDAEAVGGVGGRVLRRVPAPDRATVPGRRHDHAAVRERVVERLALEAARSRARVREVHGASAHRRGVERGARDVER